MVPKLILLFTAEDWRAQPYSINFEFHVCFRMLEYDPAQRVTLKDVLRHHFFDKLSFYQKLADDASRHILRLEI